MRTSWSLALAAAVALAATPADAQEPPRIEPGSVATVVPAIEPPAGFDRALAVRHRFAPAEGVRLLGPAQGETRAPARGPLRVPLAVWIDPMQTAGPLVAGTLEIEWPDGSRESRAVRIDVAARRVLRLEVDPPDATPANATLEVRARVANQGNAADTVRLTIEPDGTWPGADAAPVTLAPGESAEVILKLRVPSRARPGETRRIAIHAAGVESRESARVIALVGRPRGPAGLASVPATIFLGTAGTMSDGARRPVVAIEARGGLGPRTDVALSLRDADAAGTAAAFRRYAGGSEIRLEIGRPRWRAVFGETSAHALPLAGGVMSGRGVRVNARRGRMSAEILAARPSVAGTFPRDGHEWLAQAGLDTSWGEIEAVFSDAERTFGMDRSGPRIRAAGLRWALPYHDIHSLTAEAGLVRLEDGEGTVRSGPSAAARYAYRAPGTALSLHARTVPGSVPGAGGGDALAAGASRRLFGRTSLTGSAHWGRLPTIDGASADAYRGGSLGLRYAKRDVRLEIGAQARATDGTDAGVAATERRSVTASAFLPAGPARLDLRAEAGTTRIDGVESDAIALHARLPWSGARGYAAIGASWYRDGGRDGILLAHADGQLRFDAVDLTGAIYLRDTGDGARTEGWGSVAWRATGSTALVVGAERRDALPGGDPWSFSVGIRQSFGLLLPFRPDDAVSGFVFEDTDGDGRRGTGERGLPGVRLRLGALEATTDGSGRFTFPEAPRGGGRLRVDVTSLDDRSLAAPELSTEGGPVEIPIVRSASIEIRPFHDLNGDGVRDPAEPAIASHVTLRDARGRRLDVETDARGRARFHGVLPGSWAVSVVVEAGTDLRASETALEIEAAAGETVEVDVPLPGMKREIRF
ncbi:MAG TPA: hypothetical protein VM778_02895 [Gemmatimonadota bacterium]|nr:hypothetical protein [Gemmatimonadota bacterium]